MFFRYGCAERMGQPNNFWNHNSLCFAQQLENYVHQKTGIVHFQPDAVHNQTATMLEIGTNLLTQTTEQTRKLNVVEAKVISFHHRNAWILNMRKQHNCFRW